MFIFNFGDRVSFDFDSVHKIGLSTDLPCCKGFAWVNLHLSSSVLVTFQALTHRSRFCCVCHHFCIERRYKMWECTLMGLKTTAQSLFVLLRRLKKVLNHFTNLGLIMLPLVQLNSTCLLLVDEQFYTHEGMYHLEGFKLLNLVMPKVC
jgi:hypothetical protein